MPFEYFFNNDENLLLFEPSIRSISEIFEIKINVGITFILNI
jgi:hypothetical protein